MDNIDGNDPAFPKINASNGLTKREYFAATILQGLRSSGMEFGMEEFADLAVEQADALIARLNKED